MTETSSQDQIYVTRLRVVWIGIYLGFALIVGRLFYWQILQGTRLQAQAQEQYERTQTVTGSRGLLFTSDGSLLVGNTQVFRIFAQPQQVELEPSIVAQQLTEIVVPSLNEYQKLASSSADQTVFKDQFRTDLEQKIAKKDSKWISLVSTVSEEVKSAVAALKIKGIGFEPREVRYYPEASMAAHLTGFVGRNDLDLPTGYFGIEGALDKELKARQERRVVEKDALGLHLWGGKTQGQTQAGRNVVLTIRRDLEQAATQALNKGIERYGAKAGEIIIMEPSTGKILAAASYPSYDPATFFEYQGELYKNPSISSFYEPGSTFKTLTVAAGIDAGLITPQTECPVCSGPRQVGKYSIKTWNDEYHPNITITDALAKSDNTAMMFITDLLGKDVFVEYLRRFGINEKTYIELQEDAAPPFPTKWGPVELATTSFGQGISVSSLQLLKAISAIANDGVMMRPTIIEKVVDPSTGEELVTQPLVERQVIKPDTARLVSEMMEVAAASGEAKWTASKTHRVAAKTGTSQVAVDGAYDETKTIASFVGFSPPDDPKFIMLVKLVEPTSSIWAAETAAPLWYQLAEKVFLLLEIPPDK